MTNTSSSSDFSLISPTKHRNRGGCFTCRLRKKKCDEFKPNCVTCSRLGIECMGYGNKRPEWLRHKDNALRAKQEIKSIVLSKRFNSTKSEDFTDDTLHEGSSSNGTSLVSLKDLVIRSSNNPLKRMSDGESGGERLPERRKRERSSGSSGVSDDEPDGCFQAEKGACHAEENPSIWGSTTDFSHISATMSSVMNPHAYTSNGPPSSIYDDSHLIPQPSQTSESSIIRGTSAHLSGGQGELHELWMSTFCPSNQLSMAVKTPIQPPVMPHWYNPSPTAGVINNPSPQIRYLHHYMNMVVPLQYRMFGIAMSMSDFVYPLALSHPGVLESVSSLAALHLVSRRPNGRAERTSSDYSQRLSTVHDALERGVQGVASLDSVGDGDAIIAVSAHQKTMNNLRFISPQDLTAEGVVLSTLFTISYFLFTGGTSQRLREMVLLNQRCLSAGLIASPDLVGPMPTKSPGLPSSPWSRYQPLMKHMIWIDIVASISQGRASRILPTYRKILKRLPLEADGGVHVKLHMDRVMGCDDTTLLAMAEIAALSEWKAMAQNAGCLSYLELISRAGLIQSLLDERSWRESHIGRPGANIHEDATAVVRRTISDVFFGSAKVLLACCINGPFPQVPEISIAVQETLEALNRLHMAHPDANINRALVLPITIAGSHCHTSQKQDQFRSCFNRLSAEERAFGNTSPALKLMEEVWKRRAECGPEIAVDWRATMADLGWENGILLV